MVQDAPSTVGTLLTPAEAGELVRLSALTIRRKIREGELHAHRLGGGPKAPLRIDTRDLARFVVANDDRGSQ